MRRRNVLGAAATSAALASGCGGSAPSNAAGGTPAPAAAGKKSATIELEKGGTITFDLFSDAAPNWVNNFVQKAMAGFYNGLTFHRVEDWVIQGGDPRGNGTGGGQIATELNERAFTMGSVGVARGPDIRVSNDAQFFIVMKNGPTELGGKWTQLDRQYTNFGQVTDGMETARKVVKDDKIKRITIKG
jgi:peptidyl-prolyl cis-trans isomerase B (cyclophilin B)